MSQENEPTNENPMPDTVSSKAELSPEELEQLSGGGMDGSIEAAIFRVSGNRDGQPLPIARFPKE